MKHSAILRHVIVKKVGWQKVQNIQNSLTSKLPLDFAKN